MIKLQIHSIPSYSTFITDEFFVIFIIQMSSEEEESIEEESAEEEDSAEEENQDEDEQEEEDEDDDEDQQSGDQQQQSQEQQEEEEGSGGSDEEESDENSKEEKLPTFKQPPVSEQFKFQSLLSEISGLGASVDTLINTFPSHGGSTYRSFQIPKQTYEIPRPPIVPDPPPQKYTVMKDQDIQVSMQPQIVIQQTIPHKQEPKKQPYRISNESTKFLAQLYEQNKKLKRWKSSHIGGQSQPGCKNKLDIVYNSREKFERKDNEVGLINIEDRNKEIDEAIEMLRVNDYAE